jgi:hypothetical protein
MAAMKDFKALQEPQSVSAPDGARRQIRGWKFGIARSLLIVFTALFAKRLMMLYCSTSFGCAATIWRNAMKTQPRSQALLPLLSIAATPLFLAILGFTHPQELSRETAAYWRTLHLVLLPVFPLLGVNLWWLLANIRSPWAWLARILAFVYMPFYGALDVLAGIGTGSVMIRAQATAQPATTVIQWLFDEGHELSGVGVWAYLLACALTGLLLVQRLGRTALLGAVLLIAAAISFLNSHIYYPRGVLTMFAMAFAFAWLQWARLRVPAPVAHVSDHA